MERVREVAVGDKRIALITGAGGELGLAIGRQLQADGYSLGLFERNADAAAAAADALGVSTSIAVDQTDREQVDYGVEKVLAELGRIDVLVANAGYAKFGGFLEMEPRVWDRHVAINLSGTFNVCQVVARAMAKARRGGSIVITSSSLALQHADYTGAYCVTKAALLMLVRSMSAELGIHRIRANSVLPGVVDTAMTRMMLDQNGVREDLLQETPIGRLGVPEDIANAVSFLCSERSSFVTGATLSVDGGQSIYGQPRWTRQDRSTPHEDVWVPGLGR